MIPATAKDYINITSITHGKPIQFLAFLTDFSDQLKSNWSTQEVYGRMDPIYNFKNTVRQINIGFDVPSKDLVSAKDNYNNVKTLMKCLYPRYNKNTSSGYGVRIIGSPPVFRIRFNNFTKSENATIDGLLGWIDGVNYKPELESGFFVESNNFYPKLFKVAFMYNVIHEHELGAETILNTDAEASKPDENVPEGNSQSSAK